MEPTVIQPGDQPTPPAAEPAVALSPAPAKRLKPLHIAAIVLLLALAGLTGWYVVRHNHKHTQRPSDNPSQSFTYTDPHGVYTLTVPSSWQIQTDIAAPANLTGYTALAPTAAVKSYKQAHKNDYVNIVSVETVASTANAKDWFASLQLNKNIAEAKDLKINGYNAYGAKVITASGMDDHYVFTNKGTVLHLIFHQRVVTGPAQKDSTDYSQYLVDYDRLATSVKFK